MIGEGVRLLVAGADDGATEYLEDAGLDPGQVHVDYVTDPEEGIERLEQNEYDAVLGVTGDAVAAEWDAFATAAIDATGGRYANAGQDIAYETALHQINTMLSRETSYEATIQRLESELEESQDWRSLINHDIKNIASVLQGHAVLAQSGERDDFPQTAQEQTDRIVDLLERESTARRMDDADTQTYTTDYLFQTAIDDCKNRAAEKGISIEYSLDDIYTVQGISYLPDAFKNILSNAIEHSGADTVRLDVDGNDEVAMVVADDGVGISPDQRDDIFDKGEGTGTGIGLHLADKAARLSGGSLAVTESDGGGAQFTMTLPYADIDS